MTKAFVKKPFYVLVAIVVVIAIGCVSLSKMNTDLLPDFELPYLAVIVTDVGASPEEVEMDVIEPMENTLGTLSGVKTVTSTSANNYGMVFLELSDGTDTDSAMVKISSSLNSMTLPDSCGKPNIMEISMDMMASMYATVDYEGMDIKELSTYVDDTVIPEIERVEGVGSVTASGLIEDTVEVRLNQDKIDAVNLRILRKTNSKLADSQDDIDSAKSKLKKSKKKIEKQQDKLDEQQEETTTKLADAQVQLAKAQASLLAAQSELASLNASKNALEAEEQAYKDAGINKAYEEYNEQFKKLQEDETIPDDVKSQLPTSVKDAIDHEVKLNAYKEFLLEQAQNQAQDQSQDADQSQDTDQSQNTDLSQVQSQVDAITKEGLEKLYDTVEKLEPHIETQVLTYTQQIAQQAAIIEAMQKQMGDLDATQTATISGSISAAVGFGSGQAMLASGLSSISSAQEQLKTAQEQLDDAIDTARENANVDSLVTITSLSSILQAQSFKMPAGYVDDKDDTQWLVEVGDEFENEDEIEDLVLLKMDDIGEIKISDVADVVMIDNEGESYTKLNGKDAVLLSIYKSSTASTGEVTDLVQDKFEELEKDNKGLGMTVLMNQGDYIKRVLKSVLSSILLGALLAILVLALFLKDVMPTLVVAFSIPFSVLFAIVVMYFTGININVMSLAGLCIGIGMLVDNSVVVMENIYRLRNRGIPAARAAVQGTKQVVGPIVASTITTICVFLPMVYTSGTIAQLLYPFAFTISYALFASLLIAVTVVPTMGSVLLRKTKKKKHPIYDRILSFYGWVLNICLKVKVIPLGIAIALFVMAVYSTTTSGIVMMDSMESDQINVSLTMPEDTKKETSFKTAEKISDKILSIKGVEKVGIMSAGTSSMAAVAGMSAMAGDDDFTSFTFMVLTDDSVKTTKEFKAIRKQIEKKTKDIDCEELTVSSSAMGAMSSMMSSDLTVNIYGDDQDKLIDISKDVMKMMNKLDGVTEADNGISEQDRVVRLTIDRNKAADYGLTIAQIYQQLATKLSTEGDAVTFTENDKDVDVKIVNETDEVTYENLMDTKIEATTTNDDGEQETKKYRLSKLATEDDGYTVESITREDQVQYLTVTGTIDENYNSTLLSRKLQKKLNAYDAPKGYTLEIAGTTTTVNSMVKQMLEAIALGFLLVYLVMVAQFQSLLSPFIIIFTVPLAFTGGMIGLKLFDQSISAMALMGFMILMGTVVNNGIVFVDYANQLWKRGVPKRKALIATGKTRMRPILMTALTTILSMSVMVASNDAGNAMQKGMAVVVCFGLLYATLMTLFIVPVLYDILYRRKPKDIDVGSDLDEAPDEVSELLESGEKF